ncbi:MAG: helix-turn-helix transcriptional regulator [Pelomonas sp.]|nr:helix-turn-helix transcriptional regulator [Roseateles sp.]
MPRATIDPERLRLGAAQAVATLKLLGHEARLLLLCQIAQRECSVGELEALLDIRQPTLSQQLGILRRAGAVHTRREGKTIHYRLADAELLELVRLLDKLYCPKDA